MTRTRATTGLALIAILLGGCKTRLWDLESPDAAPPDLRFIDLPAIDLAIVDRPRDLSLPRDLTIPSIGCSDGTREGFLDWTEYPNVAGCAGAFLIPGVLSNTLSPACQRQAGNTGPHRDGQGCNAADLCAAGWHLCTGVADVASHSPTGCTGSAPAPGLFFITRQSSTGCGVCAIGTGQSDPPCNSFSCNIGCAQSDRISNDVFGCGSMGDIPNRECGVLDRFGNNLCIDLPPSWSCGNDGQAEAKNVVHHAPEGGGGLCCKD